MDRLIRASFGLLFFVVLSACSMAPTHVLPLTDDTHKFAFDKTEIELIKRADKAHNKLLSKGLINQNVEYTAYLQGLAEAMMPANVREQNRIRVVLLRDPMVNAFAMPNGNIYLNYGLIMRMSSEDELAFVLAHEMSHVIQRHGYRNMLSRKNNFVTAHVTDLLLLGTGLAYIPFAANIASYSREQELEADQQALDYMAAGNWSTSSGLGALEVLESVNPYAANNGSIYATHPDIQERKETLKEVLGVASGQSEASASRRELLFSMQKQLFDPTLESLLRNGLYENALALLDQSGALASPETLRFYRAEALRLRSEHPTLALKEHVALTGASVDQEFKKAFAQTLLEQSKSAIAIYQSLEDTPFRAKSYRGLGLIQSALGNNKEAANYLRSYLRLSEEPKDSLFITRTIEHLEDAENET